ncbi:hypothetical protein [Microbispora sp. NPDC046933]|uniref:hypothetical protein n=1 Tax=Microbispora sp. NPDC046933 TaxID=3155618 RepID=UPI00340DB2C4
MSAPFPPPVPDPDHTRPMSPRPSAGNWQEHRAVRPAAGPPGPPREPGLPSGGQERGVFREEALRRHAVRSREPHVPVALRGPSFLALWIAVAALVVAGVVVAVLASVLASVQMPGAAR